MTRIAIFVCFVIAFIAIDATRFDRQKLDRWFGEEFELANHNVREKRDSSANSYYEGGWKKGSNNFERVGNQKRLRCKALTKTATNEWCSENCVRGYCPQETCMCFGAEDYYMKNYQTIDTQKQYDDNTYQQQNEGYQYQ